MGSEGELPARARETTLGCPALHDTFNQIFNEYTIMIAITVGRGALTPPYPNEPPGDRGGLLGLRYG